MRLSHRLRASLIALIAVVGASVASAAYADSGTIWLTEYKGGWVFGASVGRGALNFHGKRYELSVGGMSWGLVFGGSRTTLSGTVTNISRPSDVEGVYGAAGAGAAVVAGVRAIVLRNGKGAVLTARRTGRIDGQCRPERVGNFAEVSAPTSEAAASPAQAGQECVHVRPLQTVGPNGGSGSYASKGLDPFTRRLWLLSRAARHGAMSIPAEIPAAATNWRPRPSVRAGSGSRLVQILTLRNGVRPRHRLPASTGSCRPRWNCRATSASSVAAFGQ